jgi:hypothetical protein
MTTINELKVPHAWIQVNEDGNFQDPNILKSIAEGIAENIKKIVFISHGWKTNVDSASGQYAPLWAQVLASRPATQTDTFLICFNWPSKTYDPGFIKDLTQAQINALSTETKGVEDLSDEDLDAIQGEAAELLALDPADLADAVKQATEGQKPEVLFKLVMTSLNKGADHEILDGATPLGLDELEMRTIFNTMLEGPAPSLDVSNTAAAGLGDVLKTLIKGPQMAAAWVLNQATYYEMKKRAGIIGAKICAAFTDLTPPRPLDLYLIGHSFGGRLVTSFANSWRGHPQLKLQSVMLLQAAYSQFGLSAQNKGVYEQAPHNVDGAFVITHTHNDSANYFAYFYASLVSGAKAEGKESILGGNADSPFGAMGANGAQNSGAIAIGYNSLTITKGAILNVLADTFVKNHMDIAEPEMGVLVGKVIA